MSNSALMLLQTERPFQAVLTVSGILIGFLFAGFWWALNRELTFKPEERHFKPGTALLLGGMVLVGVVGIILPLRSMAGSDHILVLSYRGLALAFILVFGYMLTELGHYRVFQAPKYSTKAEWSCFAIALVVSIVLVLRWCLTVPR
jgi:hypothetical protein